MQRWMFVAPASVLLGWVLSALHVPAAWILGAIIASGAAALITGSDLPLDDRVFRLARGAVGVMAALPLVGIPPRELLPFLLPGIAAAAFVIVLAFAGGFVLANHGVSRETGVLSLLAGGASLMPAIAKDVGADVRYVTLTQYLRLLVVSMTLPLVAGLLSAPQTHAPEETDPYWWMWLLVPTLVLVGQPLGKLLHLPNSSVFGPMLLTALLGSLTPFQIIPPQPLMVGAFLCLGWMCGGGLSVPALRQFSRLLPATLAYIVLLMAACAASGWVMSKWLGLSLYEGYLATTPGALETALALSAEGGAGPAVVSLQIIRLVCILIVAGYLPNLLRKLSR